MSQQEKESTLSRAWSTQGCCALCCGARGSPGCRRSHLGQWNAALPWELLRIWPCSPGVSPQGLRWADVMRQGGTHHPLPSLAAAQAHELLVLAGDKVDGCVLQQGGKDEEQAHGHPDVNGLHVGHLPG